MMRRRFCALVLCVALTQMFAPARGADDTIVGFGPTSSAAERALEARFDAGVSIEHQRAWLQRMSLHPHHVGSAPDRANAEFILSLYRSWGFDAKIERFETLFPTPKHRALELLGPQPYTAKLFEPPIPSDTTSANTDRLPTYNAYSVDGDVTAPLVYVNYGVPADYDVLAMHHIDVRGKIVIARFGHSWRGVKPLVAWEHGAVGCIIYSDPADDGYGVADVYPHGSGRNPDAVQRGSVLDWQTKPGNPGSDKSLLTHIPVLPISANDAQPFLRALQGTLVPPEWRGSLPFAYHFMTPVNVRAHLAVAFNWTTAPLYDVIATLRGSTYPDEWVVRGNHHDGWVHGAEDPLAGQVAMLEEARNVAALAKAGMRPKRTIVYCSWDGEEPGLLGSTAWVLAHEAELTQHAVAYFNTDTNDRGFLSGDGSSVFSALFSGVARDVHDPERNTSVFARASAALMLSGDRVPAEADAPLHIDPMGSGSDFNPFSAHIGIETLNFMFAGEEASAQYHSNYDSYDFYRRFGDPGFIYGGVLAKTGGRLVLRTVNADVIPYRLTGFADAVTRYMTSLTDEIAQMRKSDDLRTALTAQNAYVVGSDPRQPQFSPPVVAAMPPIDLTPMQTAIAHLTTSAAAADAALAGSPSPQNAAAVDALLASTERALLDPAGVPRRPWMRHQIMLTGRYTGYTSKTFPYVREAIEARRWDEARTGVTVIAAAIERYATIADQIRTALIAR